MFNTIFKIIFAVIFGALGALAFTLFLLPQMLVNPYFENYQFVTDFKQGKIVVNQKEYVYIQENTAIQEAIGRVKNSVVAIQSPALGQVSGLIATSDGSIVTLASAIGTANTVNVYVQGPSSAQGSGGAMEKQVATAVKKDVKNNLVLLKINKNNLQTIGFSNTLKLGQKVFLVAPTSLLQENWFVNEGIIREIASTTIKTTITERPLANGGPLFNAAGELAGINFIDTDGRISAVPISKIQELLGL